eukprot:Opistho-2@72969
MADAHIQAAATSAVRQSLIERGCMACGLKTLTKIAAIITSIALAIGGIFTIISLSIKCIFIGLYMLLLAIIVMLIEAPIIFRWNEKLNKLSSKLNDARPWKKASMYFFFMIWIWFCIGVTSIIAAVLMIVTGMLYVFQSVGPRDATPPDERPRARGQSTADKERLMSGGGSLDTLDEHGATASV